jgi:PhnB protein
MMFSDEFPEMGLVAPDPEKPVSASFMLYVPDVDAVYQRALDAGARPLTPIKDEFHGDRMGGIRDPFGHRWIIATHTEDVAPDEMKRRVDTWMKQNPSS